MSMAFIYITLADAIETHRKTVEVSGGGTLDTLIWADWKVYLNI